MAENNPNSAKWPRMTMQVDGSLGEGERINPGKEALAQCRIFWVVWNKEERTVRSTPESRKVKSRAMDVCGWKLM